MNNFNPLESPELTNIMNYVGYLEANGLTLDENGKEVPKDKGLTLTLNISYDDDDE